VDTYDLYKDFFNRELQRREDLYGKISFPISMITGAVVLNFFYIERHNESIDFSCLNMYNILFLITIVMLVFSVYFGLKSYNNLFLGFKYQMPAFSSDIRKFEIQIKNQSTPNNEFKEELIAKLNSWTDNHIKINTIRNKNLLNSQIFSILAILLTIFKMLIRYFNEGSF